jgi:hypothetical protein
MNAWTSMPTGRHVAFLATWCKVRRGRKQATLRSTDNPRTATGFMARKVHIDGGEMIAQSSRFCSKTTLLGTLIRRCSHVDTRHL